MQMPITEANADTAAPQTVNIDSAALGNALAYGLRQAGMVPQTQQAQAPQSQFAKKFKEYTADENNDQATLLGIKELMEAHGEDLKNEMAGKAQADIANALVQQLNRSTTAFIESSLADYLKGDELLQEYKGLLKDKVINTFNTDPRYEAARVRYGNGDVDMDLLKKLALDEINKFNKAKGKGEQVKSPTGMKNSSLSEATDAASNRGDEGSVEHIDPRDLDSKESSLYNARLGTAQRLGLKRDSKEAKELASKAIISLRHGEAKAKAKGYKPLNRR
jgi:hypothetical protein